MRRENEASSSPAGRGPGNTLEPGQILGGRYEITGYIGAGGMGAVYSARHARTGRELAVKVLLPALATRPDLMQRFMAEARAAGALNHPGIVEVVDLDREGDLHFIVMERLQGEELQARMRRGHPLDPAFVARVGADIADAIACAHGHTPKIIHRDLKPQNVFLASEGRHRDVVKILDFGIAKLVESETLEQSLTRSGEIYGTPLYMSPEQLRNPREVDERADIYAIGVIMFHALGGEPPFKGESFPDLVVAISTEQPLPLRSLRPDVPPALVAVVEKAMARSKNDRFAFAGQLRDALLPFAGARAVGDSGASAALPDLMSATVTLAPVSLSRRRRRGVVVTLGLVVAGAIAGAAALRLRQPAPVSPPAAALPDREAVAPPQPPPPPPPPAEVLPEKKPPATPADRRTRPRPRKTPRDPAGDLPPLRPR